MRTRTEPPRAERAESAEHAVCANQGCPREARPGDGFCDPCGLERSLFRRDLRFLAGRPPIAAR